MSEIFKFSRSRCPFGGAFTVIIEDHQLFFHREELVAYRGPRDEVRQPAPSAEGIEGKYLKALNIGHFREFLHEEAFENYVWQRLKGLEA